MRKSQITLLMLAILAAALLSGGCVPDAAALGASAAPPAASEPAVPAPEESSQSALAAATTAPSPAPTVAPTPTRVPPTATSVPPTATAVRPTATASPAAVASASGSESGQAASQAPAQAAATGVRVASRQIVNVRRGPGTNYDIAGQSAAGKWWTVLGFNAARDWFEIDYNGTRGWVLASLMNVSGDVASVPLPATLPATPVAGPDRIVAPTIRLDAKVIPVGWRSIKTGAGVRYEWEVASYAAGWHKNTVLAGQQGNMVISGHHNMAGEVFRYVVDLKTGDPISVYQGGVEFRYVVSEKHILADKYVSQQQRLENGKWIGPFADERLTLVTCWPYENNTHRVIVVAQRAR